jgi:hypothetical protein
MSAVNRIVVIVNVQLNSSGVPTYTYSLASGGKGDKIKLKTGDQIAWVVTVFDAGGARTPPYQLTFSNPSVLGASSLNVPDGGYSPFLQVVTPSTWPSGAMKYSLSVSGVSPVSDPLIQVDDETLVQVAASPDHYQVRWQPVPAAMTVSKNSGPFQPFSNPLVVNPGDDVIFLVDPADGFEVVFPVSSKHIPPYNPFNSVTTDLPGTNANGNSESTDKYTVRAVNKPEDPNFTFSVAPDDSAPSGNFVIAVNQ